jgi:hypothetical protein
MAERITLPQDKGELVLKRKLNGMKNSSIELDSGFDIVPRRNKASHEMVDGRNNEIGQSEYTLVARKSSREGGISSRATKLKTCKGLSGCEFVKCSKEAFGKVPPNLVKACPTFNINKR